LTVSFYISQCKNRFITQLLRYKNNRRDQLIINLAQLASALSSIAAQHSDHDAEYITFNPFQPEHTLTLSNPNIH